MNVLFCISDHGYGHATRCIPLINKLDNVIIRNTTAVHILKQETNARILEEQNDVGIIQTENSFSFNRKATEKSVRAWLSTWEKDIEHLQKIIQEENITLVISDSAPQPFLAAKKVGIPSIFFGSFTWLDIYESMGILTDDERNKLEKAYNAADVGIIMPFNTKCKGLQNQHKVGIISRNPTNSVPKIPKSVLFTTSGSLKISFEWNLEKFSGTLLTSKNVLNPPEKSQRVKEDVIFVDYVNAVDVVIAKCGYGMISEAFRCKKPIFLMKRENFIEDDAIANTAVKCGVGKVVTPEEACVLNDELFSVAEELQKGYKSLPKTLSEDGLPEAMKIIEEYT